MKKRKRREEGCREVEQEENVSRKKAKVEKDALEQFMSLVDAGDTIAGNIFACTRMCI